jgi:hypothetical protein
VNPFIGAADQPHPGDFAMRKTAVLSAHTIALAAMLHALHAAA